ncbi:MAG: hypothetical protein J6S63_07335, partial [Atopobiaceae bacterium]|nr:hypothetical protein [Atopobiaceae bacterium]
PVKGKWNKQNKTFVKDTDSPVGTVDDLGFYSTDAGASAKEPNNRNDWDIAPDQGALALNSLTGKIGGFKKIDPCTDYQAGTIHWTVRSGTRAQADKRDATVTIHFNANDGSNKDCKPIGDLSAEVYVVDMLPEVIVNEEQMEMPIGRGVNDVVPPLAQAAADGTVTTKSFVGWAKSPNGDGRVQKISDLGRPEDIAGKTFELYAIYE